MLLARDLIVGISIPSSISLLASFFTHYVILYPATNSLVTMLARLIVMSITERAQRYLSDNQSTNPNLEIRQPNKYLGRNL